MVLGSVKNMLIKLRNVYDFYFSHNRIKLKGKNNTFNYNHTCRFRNCNININGNNNSVIFDDNCNMSGLCILVEGDNNIIQFGKNVTVNASKVQPTVINSLDGHKIMIGEGALFSNNIEIHTTDYHGIYDKDGKRINKDKDIVIGKYVWVGLGCKILKGTFISNGSIVGAGSVASGEYNQENVIIVGNPAKVIKREVFWKDLRKDTYPVPSELKGKWNKDTDV